MWIKRTLALILFISLWSTIATTQKLEKVSLQLKWHHQFQFAGYYAAKAQGYYKEAGLEVTILPASSQNNPEEKVITGKVDFGIGGSDLIILRAKGTPVVVLASIFQHSPLVLLSLKKDVIQSIHDFKNSTLMLETDSAEIIAYLKSEGINTSKIKILPHSFNVEDLVSGKVDAMSSQITTEQYDLQKLGKAYITYSPQAVGIDFYSDNLFTTEKVIAEKPQMVEKFRNASIKGWYYAMAHQEEIIQLIKSQYDSTLALDKLRFEASQTRSLLRDDLVEIGHSNPKKWEQIANIYSELGLMKEDVNLDNFLYTTSKAVNYKRLNVIIAIILLLLLLAILIALKFIALSHSLKDTIKELRTTRKALNMSEGKYQLLIENNANIIYAISPEGFFTFVSSVIELKLGYPVEYIIGKQFLHHIHPEDAPLCGSVYEKVLIEGKPQMAFEYRVQKSNGEWVWYSSSVAPLKDEDGKIISIIGTASDISEIKMAQLTLQENEAKYRLLTDLSGDIIVLHRNFAKYYVNPAIETILGYSQSEFLEFGLLELVHPNDVETVERNIVLDQQESIDKNYNSDFRLRHKEGYYVDFSSHIIGTRIGSDNYITVINLRNVSKKNIDEREIRKLSTAVNQSPATIVITDANGVIEFVNPHFTTITGYTFDEAIGQNPRILQSNHHPKEFYKEMWETLLSGHIWKGEIYNKRKDGSFYWEEAIMAPVTNNNGEIINFVAIKNDISLRKNIEQKINEQNEQLRNLIETKNKFISIIAHDLRNPFHTIIGLSEVISDQIKRDSSDALETISALNSIAKSTYLLLENLLEWAHVQQNTIEPRVEETNLFNLIAECTILMQENANTKRISFKTPIDKDFTIIADKDMIKTILRNLLVNALKFSQQGGTILVSSYLSNNQINISVTDQGVGMSEEAIESLFKIGQNPTRMGTAGEKGTGFGLIICKELIERHSGTISVSSREGLGSTFTISIPQNRSNNGV